MLELCDGSIIVVTSSLKVTELLPWSRILELADGAVMVSISIGVVKRPSLFVVADPISDIIAKLEVSVSIIGACVSEPAALLTVAIEDIGMSAVVDANQVFNVVDISFGIELSLAMGVSVAPGMLGSIDRSEDSCMVSEGPLSVGMTLS